MQKLFLTEKEIRGLLEKFGSPLYVYDEQILRKCCREMRSILDVPNAHVSYSVKANTNLRVLQIAHEEQLYADTMSPGEVFMALKAGYKPHEILYVCNNVSGEEMKYCADQDILISIDSVSQMETLARTCPGARASVRVNTEFGDGHHEKVVTAGKKTKFGVELRFMDEIRRIADEAGIRIVGLNQHIGSSVKDPGNYEAAANVLIDEAMHFPDLEMLDFGGGFAVPYRDEDQELDLDAMRAMFRRIWDRVSAEHPNGKNISLHTEPGRYISAACGQLLGTVEAVKENFGKTYIGTDIGFNVLARPMLYDAYHEIVFPGHEDEEKKAVTVAGNICESGDVLAKDRLLPIPGVGDPIAILTAGAYGYMMSSTYNCRLRPAEVLIREDRSAELIRRRETFDDLLATFNLD